MQGNAIPQPGANEIAQRQSHGAAPYQRVFGPGKRRLRGLWKRGDRFYGRLSIEDQHTGLKRVRRVPLMDAEGGPVATVAAAVKALASLTSKRDERTLRLAPARTPLFAGYSEDYIRWHRETGAKSPKTIQEEGYWLRPFRRFFPDIRLREVTERILLAYQEKRRAEGVSNRTVNLELLTVRNVLRRAAEEKLIPTVPRVKPLRVVTTRKPLLSTQDLDLICTTAIEHYRNGQQCADWLRLMAYSGGRFRETLKLTWADVDFDRGQLHFGLRGGTKSGKPRTVDFNPDLEAHLRAMATRRQPDSEFLFPSPRRGDENYAAGSFHRTLMLARERVNMPQFSAHQCRHFFASRCVMAGIDFMTIAGWLGHSDGGILVGKTYGHLADEHRKAMAERLRFTPAIVNANAVNQ